MGSGNEDEKYKKMAAAVGEILCPRVLSSDTLHGTFWNFLYNPKEKGELLYVHRCISFL